jgi:transposase
MRRTNKAGQSAPSVLGGGSLKKVDSLFFIKLGVEMAEIKSETRLLEYAREFKVMLVNLPHLDGVQVKTISDCMGLHPLIVSRWRKEVCDGKLVTDESRRVQMTSKAPSTLKKTADKTTQLEKEVKRLKKENNLLKKWQRYLTETRQKDSGL